MSFRVRFKISIVTIMLVVILSLSFSVFTGLWFASSRMAEDTAGNLFRSVSLGAKNDIDHLLNGTITAVRLGAVQAGVRRIPYDGLKSRTFPFLIESLKRNSAFYSMYYGFEDGTFFQVISVRGHEQINAIHKAPKQTRWIVRSIVELKNDPAKTYRVQQWTFLDSSLNALGAYDEPAPEYDPRKRDWYTNVINSGEAGLSHAYIFNSLKQPGITASRRLPSGRGVFGVDLTLTGLTQLISATKVSENGGVLLYNDENRLLAASSELGRYVPLKEINSISLPAIKASIRASESGQSGSLQNIIEGGTEFLVNQYKITAQDAQLNLAVVAPKSDFQSYFSTLQRELVLIFVIGIIIFIPVSYGFAAYLAKHVTLLAKDVERVGDMEFLTEQPAQSRIVEFDDLIQAFYKMNGALAKKTRDLKMEQDKLTRLVELGIAMSAEKDSDKLMEMVLLGAKELTNADGGTLYIIDDEQKLQFQIIRNDTLDIALGGTAGAPANFPAVPLFDEQGRANDANVVSHAVHREKSVNIADAYNTSGFDFTGTRAFDQKNNYKSESFLTVPLKPRGGEVIGAMQIINARKEGSNEVIPFSAGVQPFIEALAAQAATALYNRDLLGAQERLMDAFIQIIAGAIDAKSPYTGGHCNRVPELSFMLAREAGKIDTGQLADFNFKTREEWREFEIGAWLHDCGKVVTPEYVVDKATKLEIIYNRIHEIRTRFEVLIRDAEIDHLKSLAHGLDPARAGKIFEDRKKILFEDFSFVADCNIGGEFMEDRDITRLQEIAKTTWIRNFDIRQGLSHQEQKRYADEPEAPCEERLLDNKASHITPWDKTAGDAYAGMGFKVEVPENRYNQGELYNLMIKRGTLTEEERFKINEHIMQTIAMLEKLPLPKHLKRVPEYAGTHHETMIGTGYPRNLDETELSIPSRIMAIADIFEALTASDRPYKKVKTLSEAVRILSFFKKDKHIDPVLFDLFLTSGVYRQYAENFLLPEQIDEVDISPYLG